MGVIAWRKAVKSNRYSLAFISLVYLVIAVEPDFTLPPITHTTVETERQESRDRGRRLMELTGVPDGDVSLVCTNWTCPTSIVVNVVRYGVATNWWDGTLEFDILTTNNPPEKIANGEIEMKGNGLEARLSAFADESLTSMALDVYATGVIPMPLDPATNMMFLSSVGADPESWQRLVYKNLYVTYRVENSATNSIATNALIFITALINEGLPAEDRIPLPPAL